MAKDLKAGQRVLNRFTGALGRVTQAYEFEGRKLVEVLYDGQDTPNTGVMAAFARVKHADLIDGYATGVLRRLGNLADLTRDLRAAGTLDDWSAGRILDAVRDAVKGVHDRASGTSYESGR